MSETRVVAARPLDPDLVGTIRAKLQAGASKTSVIRSMKHESLVRSVHDDLRAGTYWWDPVIDHVAVDRVVNTADVGVWVRLTAWEREEALVRMHKRRMLELSDKEAKPSEWVDEYAEKFGYPSVKAFMKSAWVAARRRQVS